MVEPLNKVELEQQIDDGIEEIIHHGAGITGLFNIISDHQLNRLYKYGKQIADLCWQEIKRRKEK